MNRFATLLTTAFLTSIAAAQVAVDDELVEEQPIRRYTVEVIVFSYEEDVSVGSEIFLPDEPPPEEEPLLDEDGNPILADEDLVPAFGDDMQAEEEEVLEEEAPPAWAVVLPVSTPENTEARVPVVGSEDAADLNPFELVLLPEEEFTLVAAARQFELLDAYETMMHFGWTQPTFPEEETPAIELRLLAEPPEGLDGTLTLYLSRYLHLVVDLALDAPSEFEEEVVDDESFFSFSDARDRYGDDFAFEPMPVRFRIQENRILKNGELRYFDHPKFGVLAKVTRVEEPEEEDEDSTTDETGTLAGRTTQ
jgi:hypothetical protein